MTNWNFDTRMKHTVSILNERAAAAGLIDPSKEKITYRVGSPTNGYGHYLAIKLHDGGGEHQIMYLDSTVKRDAFMTAVSSYSWAIHSTMMAMTGQEFRL